METIKFENCKAQLCIDGNYIIVSCNILSIEIEDDKICAIKCYLADTPLSVALKIANIAKMIYDHVNCTLYTHYGDIKIIRLIWPR